MRAGALMDLGSVSVVETYFSLNCSGWSEHQPLNADPAGTAESYKLQATLDIAVGYSRMYLERNNYE